MGKMIPITLLKLGGSVITNKDKPLSVNSHALRGIAETIFKSGLPSQTRRLIIVHGGGSFGHYYAKKFGLSVEPEMAAPLAVSKVAESMMDLHSTVLKSLLKSGVAAQTIMAEELISPGILKARKSGLERIRNSFALNLIPVSFGNVGSNGSLAYIISGDAICESIFLSMPVDRVILAMDVDGIYPSADMKGKIMRLIKEADRVKTAKRMFDVTGGIESKIRLGFRLSRAGAEVFYVNGYRPKRLLKLLKSRDSSGVKATAILPARRREF